jgi:glycosyltransferase involved in cell wall biosynthesis
MGASPKSAGADGKPSMRIVVCCFYEDYPPISGAASVTYNVAKFLSGEKLLIQIGAEPATIETADGLRIETLAGASENKFRKVTSLPSRVRALVNEILRFRPDFVMLEGASWAMYHWMLLRGLRRAMSNVPIVYHAHNVEYALRRARNSRAIAAITRRAEGRLLADCDLATAVSEVDQALFRELYNVETELFPNGVDVARFASVTPDQVAQVRSKYGIGNSAIIFSGLYAYPPNRVAVDFLIRDVMPRLLAHAPEAQLVVTGGDMPCREPCLITPGIVLHDELPALLASCGVAAVPIFSGSGTRLKILEAMAAGVAVVSTSKGAEGLPFHHGEHLLIADDADAFVEGLRHAITESSLRDLLTARAKDVVRQQFDWPVIVRAIDHTLHYGDRHGRAATNRARVAG